MNPFISLKNQTLFRRKILENGVLRLEFSEYILTVYNRYSLENCSDVFNLVNRKVNEIDITENISFELIFEGELKLIIFIDNDSYFTNEAMQLDGPNNLIAIWQ